MFRPTLAKKLRDLRRRSFKEGFEIGRQVRCAVHRRPFEKWGFSASIVTTNPTLGDVNGGYTLYESSNLQDFRTALLLQTEHVARAARMVTAFTFFRTFKFSSADVAREYVMSYARIDDREEWLLRSINTNWRETDVYVEEQFENGSWTTSVTQEPDT